jgi:peptidyl-prolyl cis-trans isomerase D
MATLEKIRSKAGLLVGVVGIALFAFIIGDFLRSGSTFFHQSKEKIAVVDGQSIDYREFQSNLETAMNNYKAQGASLTEEQQNQVRQMVFDQLVGSILLKKESEKVGFAVGKDERTDLLMGNNISPVVQQAFRNPQTKAFDKSYLMQFLQQVIENDDWSMYQPEQQRQLQQQKEAWLNIEKAAVEQKLYDKFSMLLASAIVANSLDAKAAYNDNSTNVDFNYVSQLYGSVPDAGIEISDAEIAKLYESRKQNYKQEPAKIVSYISVHVVPSEADFKDAAANMEKVKEELLTTTRPADVINENSDVAFVDAYVSTAQLDNEAKKFVEHASIGAVDGPALAGNTYNIYKLLGEKQAPDSIKVNLISYSVDADQSRIDSLINVIRSGKSFSEVASAESNGQFNGDMGWQTETSLVSVFDEKFANELFDAKINDLITVKSSRGTHLVQVTEKTKPVAKYKVGMIKKEVVPSTETTSKMYNDLNQYIAKNHQLEKFKSAATEAGYVCQNDVELIENQPAITGIENSRQVIRWANSHKKGEISEIFDCQGYFVVAAVDGELKAGFRPLKQLSDILKRELLNEKKGAQIVGALKTKNISSLADYATAMNSTVQEVKFVTFATPRITGIGTEPIVNVKALSSEVGQLTGPFAGKNAVYVLSLTAKNKSEQPYNEVQQKQQMDMQNSYKIMQALQGNRLLKDKATIEDNRSRFY